MRELLRQPVISRGKIIGEPNQRIFCIEDDEDTCELITFVFDQAGYEAVLCIQPDCLELIRKEQFAAIILDNHFVSLRGNDICRNIRSYDRKTPIIFLSGESRPEEIEQALAAGTNACLIKPNDFERLTETVIGLIEKS